MNLVGISVDPVENNGAMVEKLLLPFPLLSDREGTVIKTYGLWMDGDGGIARPSIFAVRPDGSVAWQYIGDDYADRPTDEEVFASLKGGS